MAIDIDQSSSWQITPPLDDEQASKEMLKKMVTPRFRVCALALCAAANIAVVIGTVLAGQRLGLEIPVLFRIAAAGVGACLSLAGSDDIIERQLQHFTGRYIDNHWRHNKLVDRIKDTVGRRLRFNAEEKAAMVRLAPLGFHAEFNLAMSLTGLQISVIPQTGRALRWCYRKFDELSRTTGPR